MTSDPSPEIERAKIMLDETVCTPEGKVEIRALADQIMADQRAENLRAVRRTLLALAVREARSYGVTVREVLASFVAGATRPELQVELDRQLAAIGVPAATAMDLTTRMFTHEEVEIGDLLLLVNGYSGDTLLPPQAREIEEMARALHKATRRAARRHGQAQVIADSINERERIANPPPERPAQTFHRTQARTVSMPGRGILR